MSKKVEKSSTIVDKNVSTDQVSKKDIDEIKAELTTIKAELTTIKTMIKDFKKDLKGLVEIQQRLVHERIGAPVPLPPKEYGEESSSKSIGIELSSTSDDRVKITGRKSFDVKETIKQSAPSKAKFNAEDKSWSIPIEYLDTLIANLEALNLVKNEDFSVNVKENNSKKEEEEEDGFGSGFI